MTTNVSRENLKKVENFFVEMIKSTGSKRIEATVIEIAEGAKVALATAHKAIKELDGRGVLSVIKPASRRFPITYIYRGDIEGFEVAQSKDEQISYLQSLVDEQKAEILELQKRVRELENNSKRKGIQNVLQNV
jgi:predicted RNase H-like nuclease (RuvC/YqgF family)